MATSLVEVFPPAWLVASRRADVIEFVGRCTGSGEHRRALLEAWGTRVGVEFDNWEIEIVTRGIGQVNNAHS